MFDHVGILCARDESDYAAFLLDPDGNNIAVVCTAEG